ncbi:MAG TPA: FGGY family carbohydrate kinase, partial [Mycobacterium sp.]|nr:FGGY family carbohydrate kinase [Mycobacterium sp.]
MSPHYLAFDIGTSGVKAVVVDADGALLDSSYRGYGLQMVDGDGVEQDLDLIITSSLEAADELLSRVTRDAIKGVSVTAQMFNLVAVDESGKPLLPMVSWLDQRSEGAARALAETVPPSAQFTRFSSVVSAKDILPKILWLRDNHARRHLAPGHHRLGPRLREPADGTFGTRVSLRPRPRPHRP